MPTYKGIRGLTIRTVEGDASPLLEGDIWYNSVTKKIRGAKTPAGAWSSGTDLNTARAYGGGVGPATNNLAFSGKPDGTATWLTVTEAYDGSAWTEVSDMSGGQANFMCGGSAESAIVAGGEPGTLTNCEEWGGSSWTAGGSLNTGRDTLNGFGASNTAALACGGQVPAVQVITETYDGSSWTEVGDLNVAKNKQMGLGTTAAGLCVGGSNGPSAAVEEWNGTGWTEVGDINTAREGGANMCYGTTTAGMIAGGNPNGSRTEQYNGTSWTEVADNSQHGAPGGEPGVGCGGGGTQTSAILSGGDPYIATVEEWDESLGAVTFTSS